MFGNLFKKSIVKQLREINKSQRDLIEIMDSMNERYAGMQSYQDLCKFPILEWVDLNKKIAIKRKNNIFGNMLVFDIKMKKEGCFNEHFHPDAIESTEVVKGKVVDLMEGETYEETDVIHYEKGQVHDILALEDTNLKVIFKP